MTAQPSHGGGTSISGSQIYGSAVASGPGASAAVHHSGDWSIGDTVGEQDVRRLIAELHEELRRISDADATVAATTAQASGVLTALEAEIERPEKRADRIRGYLAALATTVGGLGSISDLVSKLVDAVTSLLG